MNNSNNIIALNLAFYIKLDNTIIFQNKKSIKLKYNYFIAHLK